jgi:ABC-type lipoprotein export system ATPase subunit
MMAEPALNIQNLRFTHADPGGGGFTLALDDLQLAPGEQILVAGTSGSGKSTLLQLVAGLLDPDAGEIKVDGRAMHSMNVLTALMFSELPQREHRERADQLLQRLGIERPDATPDRLSVGQQQRVAVARALASRPGLVLADEPTASLDPANAKNAIELIRESCRQEGAALLLTSHDPSVRGPFERVEELGA